jgi:outer membrane protein assembly factor BamB
LVDGDRVICSPGGSQTAVVALDKMSGRVVWRSPSTGESAGYASPNLYEYAGLRILSTMTAKACIGLNAETGKLLWHVRHITPWDENIFTPMYNEPGVGKGSLTCAEGMLYTLGERGQMGLVAATPRGHELISEFRLRPTGEGPWWAHPVVCGGRLYIRHDDFLYAYDIRANE